MSRASRGVACVQRINPRPLVTIGLACLLAVALIAVLISAGLTRPFDVAIIGFVRTDALVEPLGFLRTLTAAGSTPWITAIALLVLVFELVARRPWLGIAAAAAIGTATLVNTLIKDLVRRVRPDLLPPLEIEPGYSFPSGHAALSTAAYGIVALLILHSSMPRPLKAVAVVGLTLLVFLIGLSRVYLGVHYPSDVLGGWLSGAAIVLLFEALLRSRLAPRVSREASTAPGGEVAGGDRAAPRSGPPGPG